MRQAKGLSLIGLGKSVGNGGSQNAGSSYVEAYEGGSRAEQEVLACNGYFRHHEF